MSKTRFARFDFRPLGKAKKLDNGFLKAPVYATRTGVFKYLKADGTIVREYRPPQEVFSKASLDSLAGVPVTNRHPKEMVNSKNAKALTVGFTSDIVKKTDEFVETSVTISHEDMIEEIEQKGISQVSCGYVCDMDFTPGETPEGEKYDAIQKNIVYNHLAVVDRGRAGPKVKLHLDAGDAVLDDGHFDDENNNKPQREDKTMNTATIKLDGIEFKVDSSVAAPIQAAILKAHEDGMKKKEKDMEEEMKKKEDAAQAKIDALTSDLKKAEEAKMDEKEINALVAAKTAFLSKVTPVFDEKDEVKLDEMSNLEIMKAVLVKKCDGIELEGKSEAYIEGRFDHVMSETSKETKSDDDIKKALSNKTKTDEEDAKITTPEAARVANMKKDSEAWKQPLGFTLTK